MSNAFADHLEYAAVTVSRWPAWKQSVLGGLPVNPEYPSSYEAQAAARRLGSPEASEIQELLADRSLLLEALEKSEARVKQLETLLRPFVQMRHMDGLPSASFYDDCCRAAAKALEGKSDG